MIKEDENSVSDSDMSSIDACDENIYMLNCKKSSQYLDPRSIFDTSEN